MNLTDVKPGDTYTASDGSPYIVRSVEHDHCDDRLLITIGSQIDNNAPITVDNSAAVAIVDEVDRLFTACVGASRWLTEEIDLLAADSPHWVGATVIKVTHLRHCDGHLMMRNPTTGDYWSEDGSQWTVDQIGQPNAGTTVEVLLP